MLTVNDLWSKNLYKRKNKNVSKQMEQKEQVVEDNDRDRYQKNNIKMMNEICLPNRLDLIDEGIDILN
jgi:hypothetical protein